MHTNPARFTSADVFINHTAAHNMAGPTANHRVAFPTPYMASAPGAGFPYPHNGYGTTGFPAPYAAAPGMYPPHPRMTDPNPCGTFGFPPRAAEPVSGAYPGAHGPGPVRYVSVTRATGIGAALAAGATIVFATPTTPARVIYPTQQTAAPTAGVNIIRPTPRYGVPMPGAKIVPPRQNGPPPTFSGKAFRPVNARVTVEPPMAQVNQQGVSPIPSIWNNVTSPVPVMKTPSASPPSSVWDIRSPDAVSASSTSGVHILSQLHIGSPLSTADDIVAPALKVDDVGLTSKDATPSSCISYFLQQKLSVCVALPTSSLVELSRPYIPYIRMIKEGRRSYRAVIMPVADVMSIHRELKHPYVTCDRMRKRGKLAVALSQRVYVHPVQLAAPFTPCYPPAYQQMSSQVQNICYIVPSVYIASPLAEHVTAPASYSEVCHERSSHTTGITNIHPSMNITTQTSKRKTTLSAQIVAAPDSDAQYSHGGSQTYGIWSVTTTLETKVATETQKVTQDAMIPPPCALPAPQSSISSSPETSRSTSEATAVNKQTVRFSPITSEWKTSPLVTSAVSDARPTSVSPPSSVWERNSSPNESPTTSDIYILKHIRAWQLHSQEDNLQCLTKCTTQVVDEKLDPMVKRCDSSTECKEENVNASKEESERKALEDSQPDANSTNPVQSEEETLEAIQFDTESTNQESFEGNHPNADGANAAAKENRVEPEHDAEVEIEQIVPVINSEQNDIHDGEGEDNETGAVWLEEHDACFDYPSLLISFFFGRD